MMKVGGNGNAFTVYLYNPKGRRRANGKKIIKECENQNPSSAKETVFYICDGVVLLPSLGEMRWGRRYLFWGKQNY